MKRWALAAAVIAVAAAVYFLFLRPSDEARIRASLAALAAAASTKDGENPALRALRVQREIARACDKNVEIKIPELERSVNGRDEAAALLLQAGEAYSDMDVAIAPLGITIETLMTSRTVAKVTARATLRATSRDGARQRESREVLLRLDKIDGEWKVGWIYVQPGTAKDGA